MKASPTPQNSPATVSRRYTLFFIALSPSLGFASSQKSKTIQGRNDVNRLCALSRIKSRRTIRHVTSRRSPGPVELATRIRPTLPTVNKQPTHIPANAKPAPIRLGWQRTGAMIAISTPASEYLKVSDGSSIIYSSRSTASGSTRVARRAGIKLAPNETTTSNIVTATNVTTSRELTP